VLEGVVIGALFTAAAGVLTFALHQRLPYRRLLIITGVMLLFVLIVSVGEEVNEMQLAGWIGTSTIHWLYIPGWMGTWFSLFNNWETFIGQAIALTSSSAPTRSRSTSASGASRRGQQVAQRAEQAPEADIAVARPFAGTPI
jgi:high-affinity iron transporter